jgi:hypothetical protein
MKPYRVEHWLRLAQAGIALLLLVLVGVYLDSIGVLSRLVAGIDNLLQQLRGLLW